MITELILNGALALAPGIDYVDPPEPPIWDSDDLVADATVYPDVYADICYAYADFAASPSVPDYVFTDVGNGHSLIEDWVIVFFESTLDVRLTDDGRETLVEFFGECAGV